MKTSEPLGRQIDRLLNDGVPSQVIAERLGCRLHYVFVIKSSGGWDERKRRMAANHRRRSGVLPRPLGNVLRRLKTASKNAAIIAAVDGGMTYAEAAKCFGLSRNAVAGIMSRRPEAGKGRG